MALALSSYIPTKLSEMPIEVIHAFRSIQFRMVRFFVLFWIWAENR
jgi:hypothetical protein